MKAFLFNIDCFAALLQTYITTVLGSETTNEQLFVPPEQLQLFCNYPLNAIQLSLVGNVMKFKEWPVKKEQQVGRNDANT